MFLPNRSQLFISEAKITRYLLNRDHPKGGPKAEFFLSRGFGVDKWQVLANAFRMHAEEWNVARVEETHEYGTLYIVDGELNAPDGTRPFVRVVWLVKHGESFPRFSSAYPISRRRSHART